MSRANNHGPEPCTCAERAGASWSLTTTSSKLGQYGNVVRRGVVPSVSGWCVGVMAWSPPAKEPSRKSAVGRGGQNRPHCSYNDGSRNAWILSGARIRPLKKSFKIRSWVPSPQMPSFNKTQVTRTTHTTQEPSHHRTHERNTRPNHLAAIGGCATTVRAGGRPHPSNLKKYRRDLVSSELLSETCRVNPPNPASSFRAACGQGGRAARGARAAGSKGRGAVRLSHLQQAADQRRAELQQRFADRAVHLAQRQLKNLR